MAAPSSGTVCVPPSSSVSGATPCSATIRVSGSPSVDPMAASTPSARRGWSTGLDAQRVALGGASGSRRHRFGSKGPLLTRLQEALQREDFYEGDLDENLGPRTLRALLAFQTARFGPRGDDGIVAPVTASALGLNLDA